MPRLAHVKPAPVVVPVVWLVRYRSHTAHQEACWQRACQRLPAQICTLHAAVTQAVPAAALLPRIERLRAQQPELLVLPSPSACVHAHALLAQADWAQAARIACVGPGTANTARRLLGRCDLAPSGGGARALAQAWAKAGITAGVKVIVMHGDRHRPVLVDALTALGAQVDCLQVYTNKPLRISAVPLPAPACVAVTAPVCAQQMLAQLPHTRTYPWVAMGPATARAVRNGAALCCAVAQPHHRAGLLRAIYRVVSQQEPSHAR